MHLPRHLDIIAELPTPTAEEPWRVLVSGCMRGWDCGVDGTDYGMGGALADFFDLPTIAAVPFCPEDTGLGTPRTMPDIHGGTGHDVIAGTARVLDEHGKDLTAGMLAGAEAMSDHAFEYEVHFAILTDTSAACGTEVIYSGSRLVGDKVYQQGMGVAAAMLSESGIPVLSSRDYKTLALLRARAEPGYEVPEGLLDHREHPWVIEHFGADRKP